MAELESRELPRVHVPLLFLTIFVVAGCGLIYELTAGALASYVLGDSIMQFSTVIGCYLSALGLGAWLSRYVERLVVDSLKNRRPEWQTAEWEQGVKEGWFTHRQGMSSSGTSADYNRNR